jgi:UDP-N-acetylglucosamine--N-acetylmuramyl-(pentapeptide) pyrophosphoryl-undecaprenol N-acetylglucosamine transferase
VCSSDLSLNSQCRRLRYVPLLPWKNLPVLPDKIEARQMLGLDPAKPVFLVFGGSQGASFLNVAIPDSLPRDIQVVHLAGNEKAAAETLERYRHANIAAVVKSFESNMPLVYASADYVICRSGAGTVAELIRFALPALLIPFHNASEDHQTANAKFLANIVRGASMLCEHAGQSKIIRQSIEELIRESNNYRVALTQFRKECEGRMSLSQQILRIGKTV